jgi:hypothetical protein
MKINSIYKHFKGGLYKVVTIATHVETSDRLVIYYDLSNEEKIWARPEKDFLSKVVFEGKLINRFTYIDENANT